MPAIAFQYDQETRDILNGFERFLKAEVFPLHEKHANVLDNERNKYDETGRYTREVLDLIHHVRTASAEAGFYALCVPEALGGGGAGMVTYFAFWELLFRLCGGRFWLGHFAGAHWSRGPSRVLSGVTNEARDKIMPDLLSGKLSLCFGLSEPGAGSDAAAIKTRADVDGDGWRLSGSKIWTTNAPYADHAMIFAITDQERSTQRKGGISLFLVPTNAPGFKVESVIRMWGHAGGDEALLHFDNVRIERHQLVGELHNGFKTALLGVSLGRLYNCARSIGLARWGLAQAFDYTKIRKTFGKPISDYQGVTFPLADSMMEIHAAHLMGLNVAQLLDRNEKCATELSMAKAFAVQAAARALDRVIQTHGAMGFTNEMHLTEAYIAVRRINVADGTNEILRRATVKAILDGDTLI